MTLAEGSELAPNRVLSGADSDAGQPSMQGPRRRADRVTLANREPRGLAVSVILPQ